MLCFFWWLGGVGGGAFHVGKNKLLLYSDVVSQAYK
jgi:hypothetical protein